MYTLIAARNIITTYDLNLKIILDNNIRKTVPKR